MGIKLLNNFIRKKCNQHNKMQYLFQLKNKTLVIDINVYLYRFKSEGLLMENMYNLCGLLHYYNIKGIFIFDGKPPKLKIEEIKRRDERKKKAKKLFEQLNIEQHNTIHGKKLRRSFVRLNSEDYRNVKQLIYNFGMYVFIADGEADKLCAEMVISNQAYACLSEDTDLFVYGCPIVLRYLSLSNHTVINYNLDKILKELGISFDKFKKICILSGTDYSKKQINIYKCFDRYEKIKNDDIVLNENQIKIYKLYEICPDKIEKYELIPKTISKELISNQMKASNFIFT